MDTPRSLEHARKSAKRLKKRAAAGDADAVARLRAEFGELPTPATHADCLHVVAREAGAPSWPRLKLAVETAALSREDRAIRLARAIANGAFPVVDRLLELDPDLPDAEFGLQLAFARSEAALATLARDPAAATRPIRDRPPLCCLAFSHLHKRDAKAPARQIALLDALLAGGAEIDRGMPAEPGSADMLSPLYGALGHAGNLALAEALLVRGANPNDNESLYHATELETLDGVRLLLAHNARIAGTNAFFRMLDHDSAEGVRLFLDHGADANEGLNTAHPHIHSAPVRMPLHHAILRGRSASIGALLLDHGADPAVPYDGRSPYALAMVCGNREMADLLHARGAATDLSDTERFLAMIMAGDAAGARRLLAERPGLRDGLTRFDLTRQTELAAFAESLPVLRLMAELGFDPNRKGESQAPPIQSAAWWGQAEIVEFYIGLGVDLESENMFGGTALGTAIHGSMNCPGRERGDYPRCVASLVEAGARILPDRGHMEMGSEEVTAYLEERLEPG
ncbi:MAG: hypothetical protein KDA64_15115 [Rhodospirillaceae bacterium]|nr:hypothetical protein [Rhodospirillaceae bacterium]